MTNLLHRTQLLLARSDIPLRQLAEEAGVGYEWLKKFAADSIPDPSVNRIQALHDFLSKRAGQAA